jgi:hypothetical protein
MKSLLCVMGRHDWQLKQDKEGQPYEICGRPRCYHVRGHDSRSDGPYRHQDSDRPLPLNHLRHPNRVLPPVDGEAAAPACMQKILLHAAFPNAGPGIAASTDLFGYWSVSGPPKKGAA